MLSFDANTILALLPVVGIILLAFLLVAVDLAWPGKDRRVTWVASVGLVALMVLVALIGPFEFQDFHIGILSGATEVFGGAYVRDGLTAMLDLLLLFIALLTILFGPDYLRPRGLPAGEFSAMLLFAIAGGMLIGGARDLLLLFLALELLVLPGYMLAGYAKRDGLSTEGAIKYFLLGSFSSAIFLFGLVLVFGYTGTTGIHEVAASHRHVHRPGRRAGPRAGPVDGPRAADHRGRVQDRGRAVPLLDAGRLPGLADAGHGLPVCRPQGRAPSRSSCACSWRHSGRSRRTGRPSS